MKTLTYITTKDINTLSWPEIEQDTGLYSPALRVFTDFKEASPRLI